MVISTPIRRAVAPMVSLPSVPSRAIFTCNKLPALQPVVVSPVIEDDCTRLAVPGAAVVTVEAVLNEGSSVAPAEVSVQVVASDHFALPLVAVVVHRMRASMAPVKSAGTQRVFCALSGPLSAKSSTPF